MTEDWSSTSANHAPRALDLHLDVGALGPGRRQAGLEHALRTAVREGRLGPGSALPSTRALARELGLARGTVTAAYDQLVAEGLLLTRPGAATTVAELPPTVSAFAAAARPAPPVLHDLGPGTPDGSAFPTRAWLTATRRVLARARPADFGPGDPQGRPELRAALAAQLGRTRGVLTTPDQVVITSGFYQSIGLLAEVLRASGVTELAAEDPGHRTYREVVARAGLRVLPVPVDGDGARVETLTASAVLLTPSHQYPTGVPLHPDRRRALASWARRTDGLVIEDDYDGEFRHDRRPVGAFQALAPDRTAYCGSASKTLGPALRLGWLALPPHLVRPVVEAKERADLYTETLGQLVLAELIDTHAYDRHVRAARLRYRRRRLLLHRLLDRHPDFTPHGVPAGLHTLATTDREEAALLARCAELGIALSGLTELHHDPAAAPGRPGGLLIGFAATSDHGFERALHALDEALAS
ncbi:MocR-like pyridoxine biosynthesis transcription factor PdxR [Kitasatospora albolonga]|uniref:MocR-like pyridoxine biosynthesis transcription factor PdxR n=1 Tax=Kitasatospora albolonga TaxID=68173 RepID=UPI0035E93E72